MGRVLACKIDREGEEEVSPDVLCSFSPCNSPRKFRRRVALVKSDKDSRYGLSAVVTHDGLQMPCYAVPDFATFKAQVGDKLYKEVCGDMPETSIES